MPKRQAKVGESNCTPNSGTIATSQTMSATTIKYAVLLILTIQNASVPLIMRFARTSEADPYCVPLLVIIQEIMKLFASILLLTSEVGIMNVAGTIHTEVLGKPMSTLRLAIPAGLFFLQNNCMQLANSYLPAAVFQVTYQGKTFIVAILSVLMLGRRLERFKWLGIAGLALGVSLVQVSKSSDSKTEAVAAQEHTDAYSTMLLGLAYVLTAASCSGFANVYFEKMVKTTENASNGSKAPSLWVRNIQLASFTIMLGIPVLNLSKSFDVNNPWRGFNWSVWGVAINNAWGGLLVAVIVKYGDNILKGFSNAISTVLATIISIPIFGFQTGYPFAVGVILVIWSTMVYGRMIQFKGDWWNTVPFTPQMATGEESSLELNDVEKPKVDKIND
ncbi:hypothetical protein AAMO2058_001447600 [Amorphochlora amoebiformis]